MTATTTTRGMLRMRRATCPASMGKFGRTGRIGSSARSASSPQPAVWRGLPTSPAGGHETRQPWRWRFHQRPSADRMIRRALRRDPRVWSGVGLWRRLSRQFAAGLLHGHLHHRLEESAKGEAKLEPARLSQCQARALERESGSGSHVYCCSHRLLRARPRRSPRRPARRLTSPRPSPRPAQAIRSEFPPERAVGPGGFQSPGFS